MFVARDAAATGEPVAASLVIRTSAEQKETSSAMLQALMLRVATGIPAVIRPRSEKQREPLVDPTCYIDPAMYI